MGLIKCPECTKEVSSQAKFCPNCGFHISGVINPLLRLWKRMTFKVIPKENVCVGGRAFILPFHKAMYAYFQPRFRFLYVDKDSVAEFYTTIAGDLNQVFEIIVSDGLIKGFTELRNKEKRILAVFDMIQDKVLHDKLSSGNLKIVNRETFHNGHWRGGIMELVGSLENGSTIKEAHVVFGAGNSYMDFITYASKSVDGVDPAVIYEENVRFFKLCFPADNLPKGLLEELKEDKI